MTTEHHQFPGALNRASIENLIRGQPPLLEAYRDLSEQLQANGFDLTIQSVSAFVGADSAGAMGVADGDRRLPDTMGLGFDGKGWAHLDAGPYLFTFNEIVNLPLDLMALVRPRSSLLRSGVAIHTAVWDAGYSGRSEALMTVHHPDGFWIQRDARVAQMVFFRLDAADAQGYAGRYQGENL